MSLLIYLGGRVHCVAGGLARVRLSRGPARVALSRLSSSARSPSAAATAARHVDGSETGAARAEGEEGIVYSSILKFVENVKSLPAESRFSVSIPGSLFEPGQQMRASRDYVFSQLIKEVLRPGSWRREYLVEIAGLQKSNQEPSFCDLLQRYSPNLLGHVVLTALLRLPSQYSLTVGELQSLIYLLKQAVASHSPMHGQLLNTMQGALALRRADIMCALQRLDCIHTLMSLFTFYTILYGSWFKCNPFDKRVAYAFLDRLAVVLAGTSYGGQRIRLTDDIWFFCKDLLLCRIDHPYLMSGLEKLFQAFLLQGDPSHLECCLMAVTLSWLRHPAPELFQKLGAHMEECASPTADWSLIGLCDPSGVPHLIAWAFFAQGVGIPVSCLRRIQMTDPNEVSIAGSLVVDACLTALEQVSLAVGWQCFHSLQVWEKWSKLRIMILSRHGFEVNTNIGGLRVPLIALVNVDINGSVHLKPWRQVMVRPVDVSWSNVDELPGIPVAVIVYHRDLFPTGRLLGPHARKEQLLAERGWAVVAVSEDTLAVDNQQNHALERMIQQLKASIFSGIREWQLSRPKPAVGGPLIPCQGHLPVVS